MSTKWLSWEVAQARYFDPTFGGAVIPGPAQRDRTHRGVGWLRLSWMARATTRRWSRHSAFSI